MDLVPCPFWVHDHFLLTTGAPTGHGSVRARLATDAEVAHDVVNDTTEYADVDDRLDSGA